MEKKILTLGAIILATGVMLNTIYNISPKPVEGRQDLLLDPDYQADLLYIENSDQKDTILEEGISTDIYHDEYQNKVANVKDFLEERNSPLAQYASEFVDAAEYYNIDYRLLPAISIVESSGGRNNFRRHNAWGWGTRHFKTWEEGIWSVSEGLANYYASGLNTPSRIATRYCPANATNWASKVGYLLNQMDI
ncbi:hypothetical protein GX888_02610 [Candidatus Dojkabacteria bacterium]|uniref:Mannosyl-glycoprotein endo-beta-N-acetylglucosamidase-like domain-containing protein n=1 Tax=Candidatus Dojkabacteria bacterium TaxID=2099670 RepID=A0A847VDL5_9BACT|nr:hypothetical protein [Candidatus Dojkabacteria bacterium]